jgi:mono/diheme cytochrome c family protein
VKRQQRFAGPGTFLVALAALGLGAVIAWGQQRGGHDAKGQGGGEMHHGHMRQAPGQPAASSKDKDKDEDEDEEHGPPEGWKLALPKGGDPVNGRAVFVKLECFSCHEVKGETFPPPAPGGTVGPELSAMAPHHPPEFFAESIINPGAVIDKGRGYEAPDGTSKMPSFNEDLTVKDLLDLVAYLVNLKPAAPATPAPAASAPAPVPPAPGGDHRH